MRFNDIKHLIFCACNFLGEDLHYSFHAFFNLYTSVWTAILSLVCRHIAFTVFYKHGAVTCKLLEFIQFFLWKGLVYEFVCEPLSELAKYSTIKHVCLCTIWCRLIGMYDIPAYISYINMTFGAVLQ